MKISSTLTLSLYSISAFFVLSWAQSTVEGSENSLPTLYVDAQETANLQPVTTFASPVSGLEFNPRVDLQSRNMAEAQGDVSIRGGIFENTGFRVGAATLHDPQTGHYFAEIPIAPEMLDYPRILTGADNALYGFNSTVGTIDYSWRPIAEGGSLTLGGGNHDLNFQRIHHALTGKMGQSPAWTWGAEAEFSRSESDGTLRHGDHDFERFSGRLQLVGPHSQTDFLAGYQAKFFGWPGMYTADVFVPFPPETENLKTRLFLINHQQDYANQSSIELTAYHLRHSDEYTFNRFTSPTSSIHETKATALAAAGRHVFSEHFAVNNAVQITGEAIKSNTLDTAPFLSRTFFKVGVVPEYKFSISPSDQISIQAGATFDDTNRDSSAWSPIAKIEWEHREDATNSQSLYLSYAESTQVTGYTALAPGNPLFLGRTDLGREKSRSLELGSRVERPKWSFEATVFYRWDDDLVDWTFDATPPLFARSANNVDIETFGVEIIGTRTWGSFETVASYAYLHKDEDYGDDTVIGSFYALNYPEHRATLGLIWRPIDLLEFRVDNEWRQQHSNDLRNSSDHALFTHAALSIFPPQIDGLEIFFAIDNAWDDDFEEVPGTPGRGDQYSLGVTYRW